MPIEASPVVPVRQVLERSDPSGETVIWIRPHSGQDDLERGELTKTQRYTWDEAGLMSIHVEVNPEALALWECWRLYSRAELVLMDWDDSGERLKTEPFKPKSEMTLDEFRVAWFKLPMSVRNEWHNLLISGNRGWVLPF